MVTLNGRLKQPTTLMPFMRKSIVSADIAMRTGNHQIIRPVRPSTSQRNNVINVVFSQFITAPMESTSIPPCDIKVFRSSGEKFFTALALLLRGIKGYSIIHDKGHSLSSRRRMLAHRSGKTLLPPQYTINPPLKQLCSIGRSGLCLH